MSGRLPDPGLAAICARCDEPREAHGGSLHLGACPDQRGPTARRFQLREEDKALAAPTHPETWTCVVCGATNVHGANRWARVRAYDLGWYSTRDEEMRFCPAHCPPFAANYRSPE